MSFTSITQRFVAWFLVISLLPILLIGYSLLQVFENILHGLQMFVRIIQWAD